MKSKKLIFLVGILGGVCALHAASPLYVDGIKNDTPATLYKVYVPSEDYTIIVFPGTEEQLGSWLDLHKARRIYIAAIKGEGESITVEYGPEPSGACPHDMMPHTVISGPGWQNAVGDQKLYQAYCPTDNVNAAIKLRIDEDGRPETVPSQNVVKLSQS